MPLNCRGARIGLVWVVALSASSACSPGDALPASRAAASGDSNVTESAAPLPVDSLLVLAEAHFLRLEYEEARALWSDLLLREEGTDGRARATALNGLGLVALQRDSDFDRAERLLEEALDLKVREGLTDELYSSHNNLGLLSWWRSRFPDAERHYREALRLASDTHEVGAVATARMNLALVQVEWGDFAGARAGFLALRDTMMVRASDFDDAERAFNLGAALTNLGMLELRLGNPVEAIEWLTEAVEIYREGNPAAVGFALGHLANAHAAVGNPMRAFSLLDSAIAASRGQGLRYEEVGHLEALARQYREAGDYRRALARYAEARAINAELGLVVETGANLRGEAEVYLAMGSPESALPAASEALTLHEQAGAFLGQLYDHLMLAEVADAMEEEDVASTHLDVARGLSRRLSVRSARVAVALAVARRALAAGDHASALGALGEVSADVQDGGYEEQSQAYHLTSMAHARAARSEQALEAGWRAFETVERVRDNYGSGPLRVSFAADKQAVYAHLIATLLDTGRIRDAFAVSDAARGRALIPGATVEDPTAPGGTRLDEVRLSEIERVLQSIEAAESATNAPKDPQALVGLYARVAELRAEYEEGVLRRGSGGGRTQGLDLELADEIAEALGRGDALIEYFAPSEGPVRIFVVRDSGVRVLDAGLPAESLEVRVRIARGLISEADEADGLSTSNTILEALYDALLEPLRAAGLLTDVRRIIVVPHGALTYLPFAALRSPQTGRFVGEDFAVRVLPTAAEMILASRPVRASASWRGGTVLAPLPEELPASRREADAVLRAMAGARRLVGEEATELELRRALQGHAPVHVATHGVMNAESPMFSRILLAEGGDGGSRDDGQLEVHELLDFRADSPLVFLSGCETGLGRAGATRFSLGEDYATLGSALLHAGVDNVVATLWRVDDEASSIFAALFYEALADSEPEAALAHAQDQMRARPGLTAPYYWAGYQLLGAPSSERAAQ